MTHSFAQAFILLVLVTDPLGNVPIVSAALKETAAHRRARVVVRECLIAFVLLVLFMLFGQQLLDVFRLSEAAVRVSGGAILLIIALRMVFQHPQGVLGQAPAREPLIVPLAIPTLAGPSALATVLLFDAATPRATLVYVAAMVCVTALWMAVFLSADRWQARLGPQGMAAIERLMGLVLSAMAVEMLFGGIRAFAGTL